METCMFLRKRSEGRDQHQPRHTFLRRVLVTAVVAGLGCFLHGESVANTDGPILIGRVMYTGAIPRAVEVAVTEGMEYCGESISIQPLTVNSVTHGVEAAVVSIKNPKDNPNIFSIQTLTDNLAPHHVEETIGGGKALRQEEEQQSSLSVPTRMVANLHCRFIPRVVVAKQGVMLEIRNLDPILHQTHLTREERTKMNIAQLPKGHSVWKELEQPGVYHFKCDKHTFMDAYLLVFDHPFFSKTNADGAFRIAGLSPGNQTIRVWHETLGILEKEITLPDHGIVTIDLVYSTEMP